jgi:hypothetical protein
MRINDLKVCTFAILSVTWPAQSESGAGAIFTELLWSCDEQRFVDYSGVGMNTHSC